VRNFTLEGAVKNATGSSWVLLVSKQAIGHKRIELLPFSDHGFTGLRLTVTATLGDLPPVGLKLEAFESTGCQVGPPCVSSQAICRCL
jgi:hypothetical protein